MSDQPILIRSMRIWREEVETRVTEENDFMRVDATEHTAHYEVTLMDGSTVHYCLPVTAHSGPNLK